MILNDICTHIVDCEHKTAPTQKEGYPSIRTPNIGRGFLILENVNRVSLATYNKWTTRIVPKAGDIIMAREAPVGNLAMIPVGLQPCLGQRTLLIRCKESVVNPRFLVYFLISPKMQAQIQGLTNGATVTHLNMKDVRGLAIPELPPLDEQNKIASILSAYDDLIENNTRRIQILEEMAQAIYREWFVEFRFPGHENVRMVDSPLDMIPEGWEVKKISNAFDTVGGGTPSTKSDEYWRDGKVQWFTPSDLTKSRSLFLENSEKKITEVGLNNSSARLFPANSVMMTSRATIGAIAINTRPATTNQGFITCIPSEKTPNWYIYYWIMENKDKIEQIASGATFKEISRGEFRDFDFLQADIDTINDASNLIIPIWGQIKTLIKGNINLREQRDLLLPKLIDGEIIERI